MECECMMRLARKRADNTGEAGCYAIASRLAPDCDIRRVPEGFCPGQHLSRPTLVPTKTCPDRDRRRRPIPSAGIPGVNPTVTIHPAHFAWEAVGVSTHPRGQPWTRAQLLSSVPAGRLPPHIALKHATVTDGADQPA